MPNQRGGSDEEVVAPGLESNLGGLPIITITAVRIRSDVFRHRDMMPEDEVEERIGHGKADSSLNSRRDSPFDDVGASDNDVKSLVNAARKAKRRRCDDLHPWLLLWYT